MPVYISWRSILNHSDVGEVLLTSVTDVPCHCWARVSRVKPKIHRVARMKRGLSMPEEYYFCFTSYRDYEQNEAGDTLFHSFTIGSWPFCTTKYYYFYGQQAGVFSPSTSAWWKYHNWLSIPPPTFALYALEPWTIQSNEPPDMVLLFDEPWTGGMPDFTLLFNEPWYVQPPAFDILVTEYWSS